MGDLLAIPTVIHALLAVPDRAQPGLPCAFDKAYPVVDEDHILRAQARSESLQISPAMNAGEIRVDIEVC
jgi:hypothetical protein